MNLIICKDSSEVVTKTNEWCKRVLKNSDSLFLPTGNTPLPIYENWEKTRPEFLNNKQLIQLDEIVTGVRAKSFWAFLKEKLPSYINQVIPVQKAQKPAKAAILGLGLNGHIAFHEPGVPDDFYKGEVPLSALTRTNLKLEDGTKGHSFGLKAILECQSILLIIRGQNKKEIYQRFLDKDISLPAVKLMNHPDFTVLKET